MSPLTESQRYTIFSMLNQRHKQIKIAEAIGKHKSVISREIQRNKDQRNGVYRHDLAQRKYTYRQKIKPKQIDFTVAIEASVSSLLKEDYSPEQVVGSLRMKGEATVSYVWKDKKEGGTLHTHLRRKGRRYSKRGLSKDTRGIIKDRIGIENRPKIVEERQRCGDLEVDLIIGKNHKQAILTINDRASGMLKMTNIPSKKAKVVCHAIIDQLQPWKLFIKTITSDNGKEFADHQNISKQRNTNYYFATPYHSWERGANENLNGLIRQYFPKKTDFNNLSNEQPKNIENKLNHRPRKRFNYQNPIFVINQLLNKKS